MTPRSLSSSTDIESALLRVGELLAAAGEPQAIVIVGGAALGLLGIVARATRDVDILAFARPGGRDSGLADDWLNTGPALQWKQGLPPGLATRIEWRQYAALRVGLAGRLDLIWLKLYAAADDRPEGRHVRDLTALDPTDAELEEAAGWVKRQDAGPAFPGLVDDVVNYVRARRSSSHR